MPGKILYVEDEIFLAKIVSETLQSHGYEVASVHDGAEAARRFESFRPDLCILDVMLPNRDGFEVADDIRAVDETVPIIFLTARSATSDVVTGFRAGGNDYIRKPFSLEELMVRIENQLKLKNGGSAVLQEEVPLGAYRFFPRRQLLVHPKEERKLSYRENELLKLLYGQRDGVVERRDILNLLWGSDSFFNSRNLDVYITKIRAYLKLDPSIEIITVKGVGYRFVIS